MWHFFLKYESFCLLIEFSNLFLHRLHIGNINISRRSEGVPDSPVPVLYPFVTVLSVGAGGAVSIQLVGYLLPRVSGTTHVQGNGRIQP